MEKSFEYDVSLEDETLRTSQGLVAKKMGISEGAVWQMLKNNREIFLVRVGGGFKYKELKEIDKRKSEAA